MLDSLSMEAFWNKVNRTDDCWEWTSFQTKGGYGLFRINAHRMAWVLTNGAIPDGMLVCHHCDNRLCVNPDHLFIGSPLDNMLDKVKKGRHNPTRGERSGTAKLTWKEVGEIRAAYLDGEKQRDLAARYGVGQPAISVIVNEKRWHSK